MKFFGFLLTLFFAFNVAFAQDVYHAKMADSDIYVISLKTQYAPVGRLITDNEEDQNLASKYLNKIKNHHNVMLVKNQNFIALIDVGYADTTEKMSEILKELGVEFSDITHLIITHAHGDHIGGIMTKDGANNFKNAKLLIDKKEHDFWLNSSNEKTKAILGLFKDNTLFFDHSKKLLQSELDIRAIPAYGHTPGHNMISFKARDQRLVFWADLIHVFDVQIQNPKIPISFDINKDEAIKTREKFLKEFRADKALVVGTHVPFVEPIILK